MIGTVVGALSAGSDAFLGLLAPWGGICAFNASVLHNFASYGAALAGFTATIIAGDNLGATGGASPDVFGLAIMRASEICIGIACAGIVLTVIHLGGARRGARQRAGLTPLPDLQHAFMPTRHKPTKIPLDGNHGIYRAGRSKDWVKIKNRKLDRALNHQWWPPPPRQ
jgi:hypothetical protein